MTILRELEEIIGIGAAQRFIDVFAAKKVTFPKSPDHPAFDKFVRILGVQQAELLRRRFAGQQIYVPQRDAEWKKRRDADIASRLAAGESPDSIAASYVTIKRLSVMQVFRIAKAAGYVK